MAIAPWISHAGILGGSMSGKEWAIGMAIGLGVAWFVVQAVTNTGGIAQQNRDAARRSREAVEEYHRARERANPDQ